MWYAIVIWFNYFLRDKDDYLTLLDTSMWLNSSVTISPFLSSLYIQVHKISQAKISTEIIFNCQMGRGRTTTGMVIATLVYLNRIGSSGSLITFCTLPFKQVVQLLVITNSNVVSYFPMKQAFQEPIPLGECLMLGLMLLTTYLIQKTQFVEENMLS